MKKTYATFLLCAWGLMQSFSAMAQDEAFQPAQISQTEFEQLQSDNELSKRLKISGYLQFQYQVADTAGISSVAGGNFSSGVDNRFSIRRGRLKLAYESDNTQGVFQIDLTEKGLGLKDAYLSFLDPYWNTLKLTGGVFDRPFGYEISYSSSARETPERSRVFQTLFPGERDLGAKLTIQAPKTSYWNFIKLDLGLFAGNGIAVETDSYKDFMAHLAVNKTSIDERMKWGLGASVYSGGFAATTTKTFALSQVDGVQVYLPKNNQKGARVNRSYVGFDGQYSMDWFGGITQIRAEYLFGNQPGTYASSSSLTAANTTSTSTANLTTGVVSTSSTGVDVYQRKFQGYYLYLIQNIMESPFQLVVKYDSYDPNTGISGNQIGTAVPNPLTNTTAVKTNATDIAYATLGVGLNYRINTHLKCMAYYDMVQNEKTMRLSDASTLKDLSKDRKDNVFTLRLQYKF